MYGEDILAWSLPELKSAEVPVQHGLASADDISIHHHPSRLSPNHIQVVYQEVDNILEVGGIVPDTSAWLLSVAIGIEEVGKSLCVDERLLNMRTKADRCSLLKVEEAFDSLIECKVFTTLHMFSGYWKIKLDESCKKYATSITRTVTYQLEVMLLGFITAYQRLSA